MAPHASTAAVMVGGGLEWGHGRMPRRPEKPIEHVFYLRPEEVGLCRVHEAHFGLRH